MNSIQDLVAALGSVQSDADAISLFDRFGIRKAGKREDGPFFGTWKGRIGDLHIKATVRWHDPSGPFSIQPDIHIIELAIYDDGSASVETHKHRYQTPY